MRNSSSRPQIINVLPENWYNFFSTFLSSGHNVPFGIHFCLNYIDAVLWSLLPHSVHVACSQYLAIYERIHRGAFMNHSYL